MIPLSARRAALIERIAERAPELSRWARDDDEAARFPTQGVTALREEGALAATLPVARGGLGLGDHEAGWGALLELLLEIGRADLNLGRLYEGHVDALDLIARYGDDAQREQSALRAQSGALFGVWNTDGADPLSASSRAAEGWELVGGKIFCSGAGGVDAPIVTARFPDERKRMVLLEARERHRFEVDTSWWRPMGMRSSVSGRIACDGLELRPGDVIGGPDDYERQPRFSGGAIRFAAVQLGGAWALLDILRDHLRRAKRGDDPFQRQRVARAAIACEGARGILDRGPALRRMEARDPERIIAHANLARSAVEAACLTTLAIAQRGVGAAGMLKPHPLERVSRDLSVYTRQPAPDAALCAAGAHLIELEGPAHRAWDEGAGDV